MLECSWLAASIGLGRKEQPLWMRCIVLAVRAGWSLRESRNFHTDGCWQDISALKVWWQASKAFVVRVEPAADLSKAFHTWIGKSGVKRRVAPTGVPIYVFSK